MRFLRGTAGPASALVLLLHLLGASPAAAVSDSLGTAGASPRDLALRVYLDCSFCDQEFIRSEITFVNYVRDRLEAQVHVLVTRQQTGSGGREYTVTAVGRRDATGRNDTLSFAVPDAAPEEKVRQEIVRVLQLALVPFAARTPLADRLSVRYEGDAESPLVADPWDSWVFRASLRGWFNGEQSRGYASLSEQLSASRVTPDLKLSFSAWGNYAEDRFDVGDATLRSISRGLGAEAYAVVSLGPHWSWGGVTEAAASTFSNRALAVSLGPAVEYNIFPYDESTRRQFRLEARGTYQYVRYDEETIFDKLREHLLRLQVAATFEMIQPWGSVEARLSDSQYLHDLSKNRVEIFLEASVKLVEGLSLEGEVSYSRVHDQLGLRKSGATTEEILLQRRQLASQYQYWASFGISYSFGSIFNNVVNPRFGN